jgi:hypothetical protein
LPIATHPPEIPSHLSYFSNGSSYTLSVENKYKVRIYSF